MSETERPSESASSSTSSPSSDAASGGKSRRRVPIWLLLAVMIATALATAGIAALLTNMFQRKQEARNPYVRLVEVDDNTTDPQPWGINWSREYDGYSRTVDQTHTRYGGSDGSPSPSRLAEDPWLKRMFAGYAFAIDFRQRRGHAYMLADQEQTRRVLDKPQTGACLNCHSSIIPTYRRLGLEQQGKTLADAKGFDWPAVFAGFQKLSVMTYVDAHAELLKTPDGTPNEATPEPGGSSIATTTPANLTGGKGASPPTTQEALAKHVGEGHPVSCVDCHNPETMALRVTRPAFVIGIQNLATSEEPVPHLPSIQRWRDGGRKNPYDPNVDATRQEMRSFACAQCHVEYYCGPKVPMFFPWGNGLKVEQIEKFYDDMNLPDGHRFYDFTHAESGAEVLKAQHPEFETWSQGVHARSGVACADCHMPYTRQGALKISDHWIRSPMLNVSRSCQTCHPFSEDELHARVAVIQRRHNQLMQRAGASLDSFLNEVAAAKKAGMNPQQLAPALALQRKAQWRLDFSNAENSMGFHASQEGARTLGESIDYFRQAELIVLRLRLGGGAPASATQPAASTSK
jgi:nitrite reductase (cytochrome c-552)